MSDNLELFDFDHAELGQLLDRLDSKTLIELKNKWPQLLADLIDLMTIELQRQGVDNSHLISSKLVAVIAHYFGGRAVYLPTGDNLKIALRDYAIFDDWTILRGDIDALMKKYGLTQSPIYVILRQQMSLHRKRNQIDLFESGENHHDQ